MAEPVLNEVKCGGSEATAVEACADAEPVEALVEARVYALRLRGLSAHSAQRLILWPIFKL